MSFFETISKKHDFSDNTQDENRTHSESREISRIGKVVSFSSERALCEEGLPALTIKPLVTCNETFLYLIDKEE